MLSKVGSTGRPARCTHASQPAIAWRMTASSVMSPTMTSSATPAWMGLTSIRRVETARLPRRPSRSIEPTVPPAPVINTFTAQSSGLLGLPAGLQLGDDRIDGVDVLLDVLLGHRRRQRSHRAGRHQDTMVHHLEEEIA